MKRRLGCVIAILVIAAAIGVGIYEIVRQRGERGSEGEEEKPIETPSRVSRTPAGQAIVILDLESQKSIGLKSEVLATRTMRPDVIAYGTLEQDPSHVFVLRASVAGSIQSLGPWPDVGATVADDAVVGQLTPLVSPANRVDLESRLASAKADVLAATASEDAARAAYGRLKDLNAEDKNVSDKAVQEALAQLEGQRARLEAARATVKLVQDAIASQSGPTGPIPLRLDRGGVVVELLARPGEAVEAGASILRVARFDDLLATVTIPASEQVMLAEAAARVIAVGHEDLPIEAAVISIAPAVDPRLQGQSYLLRVPNGRLSLRPGLAVTAHLASTAPPRAGVVVPRSAIVRYEGKAWAYAQEGPDRFSRRPVATDEPVEAGWFVATGWREGDRAVVVGGQMLLSEELKSQIRAGQVGG